MHKLVVTCYPNGSVETLLKDKVLDTRMLSNTRKIERISEILPTDDGQEFYVRWLKGPLLGHKNHLGICSRNSISVWSDGEPKYFHSYESAVNYEIDTVNTLRLDGHSFT